MNSTFNSCGALTTIGDVGNWNTGNVTNMRYMFNECGNLTSLDTSNWDTSKVTSMTYMFCKCHKIKTVDVSKWDVSNVTTMESMFSACHALETIDVSNWNVEKLNTPGWLFNDCVSLKSIDTSKWKLQSESYMTQIFKNCRSLEAIDFGNVDFSRTIECWMMFYGCSSLKYLDISNFNSDVFMKNMVAECPLLTDIGMVYADVTHINKVAEQLNNAIHRTIWIGAHLTAQDIAALAQYDHITYKVHESQAARLMLTSPLLEGDVIEVIDGQLCHVHNMGMIVLNGSEKWSRESTHDSDNYRAFYTTALVREQYKYQGNVFSNYYKRNSYEKNNNAPGIWLASTFLAIKSHETTIQELKDKFAKNPMTVVYELVEPYTEVIDLPRAEVSIPLYENGSLYMSDPTASINQVESDTHLIINGVTGDSVVNVSNQQGHIKLTEQDDTPQILGEILETSSVRPTFEGKTLVNLMYRVGWSEAVTEDYVAYIYGTTDVTNTTITVTNFNDKPILIGVTDGNDGEVHRSVIIDANSTNVIELSASESLYSVFGRFENGWTESTIHELKNINIFEGNINGYNLPESKVNGLRNSFDANKVLDSNDKNFGKYRVAMTVHNNPIQFGKAGRR
jgi:surface protein